MGLASDVGGAVSEGVNYLCALLEWNDTERVNDFETAGTRYL